MKTKFDVFGQPVELVITSDQVHGSFCIGRQTCGPGTGTPPHIHEHEDEVFSVVSGCFEIFDGATWTEIPDKGVTLAPRGHVHCFRNCGDAEGVIQFLCSGNQLGTFLEGLSPFVLPQDMQAMVDYSAAFGITYPTLIPPSGAAK